MMKTSSIGKMTCVAVAFFVFVVGLVFMSPTVCAKNTVNDLRGRWDFFVEGLGADLEYFTVYIGNLNFDETTGAFLASGCMESPSMILSPLAVKAEYEGDGSYNVSMISTVIPDGGAPFVVQFFGPIHTFGNGVPDDMAGGDDSIVRTDFLENGKWTATHHDRRKKKCPPVEIPPLSFGVDVRLQLNLRSGNVELKKTILEAQTDIASSGVLVEKPDGTEVVLAPYTDIFSPDVDFVSSFRYIIPFDEADENVPIAGEVYYFTLLDVLGNPISGSIKSDIWTGCYITAPGNFNASLSADKDILVSWDSVDLADGFDPANGIGFYQIEIGGSDTWTPDLYGSNHIKSTSHTVPWDSFTPGSPGFPDGSDLGISLENFPEGTFSIRIEAFSEPPAGSGGFGHECVVVDFDENLSFTKEGEELMILP